MITSSQMLVELADVLSRGELPETEDRQIGSFLSIIARGATVVKPKRSFEAVPDDPDDDVVIETAYEGKASHIVSGDRHLLNLGRFRGIRVVTASEMLELIR